MGLLQQAVLVAATAVIVAFVIPAYLKPTLPVPEIFGTVAPGFEEVRETFRRNYVDGWDVSEGGSAFSVYKDGEVVVDLWAGYADYEARRLWRKDTMSIIFSTTKGLAALCVGMLADRGNVDLKKPVSQYWPEFAQNGKDKITVEQLLEHEAGLYVVKETLSFDLLRDHERMDRVLAESEPLWEPGTHHGYHAVTSGPLLDALVRRVDPQKRTIGQFFEDEVRKPFDIDAYIGAPVELDYRTGRCVFVDGTWSHMWYALRNDDLFRKVALSVILGGNEYFSNLTSNCGEVCENFNRMADPEIRKIEVASANGVATARGLAKLFGILANGGKAGSRTLLSKKMIDEYANDRRGPTPDLVLKGDFRWKYGMHVIPQPNDGSNLFGSAGSGGQAGYADPDNRISYGFISRYMSPMGVEFRDPRLRNLRDSVLRCISKKQ